MDFYFFTSLVNMLWQIFTILFVLYRFTSFFSMMYNFILFLGKLLKGVYYVKDQITRYIAKKRGYSYLSGEELNGLPSRNNQSWYNKIKSWIFGSPRRTTIPLYETRTSYIHNLGASMHDSTEFNAMSPRSSRPDLDFEHTMMNSSQYESDFYVRKNMRSSIYPPPPPQHRRTQSNPSISSRYESTITINDRQPENRYQPIQNEQKEKPFNVEDSNMLFNSQFLTKILHPFASEEPTEKDDNENKDAELEKALLHSDYNEI